LAPNGSGKTTLFECLAGLMPANTGTIRARQVALSPAARKQTLFYLPDSIFPWAEQRVKWAIEFFRRLYRTPEPEAEALVKPLRLEELMSSQIGSLSKGERKRVLLALGLLTPHHLLMLDEPFDGLDLRQTRD
jgi:ABC-2 type transport system ATP-binding protein